MYLMFYNPKPTLGYIPR